MTQDKNNASEKNLIIRKAKKNNFSIISNSVMQDVKLSWKAKGLLCYLLHLPDDWRINTKHLEKQATDGRHSLKVGLIELQKAGYLTHENLREKGKFIGHVWTVYEEPCLKTDKDDKKPQAENPPAENPHAEKQPLLITKESESKDSDSIINTKKSSSSLASSSPIDDDDRDKNLTKKTIPSESVTYVTPKGEIKTISSTEIFSHFVKFSYSTEIVQQAIAKFQSIESPVSDPLAYLDSVCKSLNIKKELPKKNTSFKTLPRESSKPPKYEGPVTKGIFL